MFDSFLNVDGIPGESTDDKHSAWIEVLSFGHEMLQPVSGTRSSAGGASGGGRAMHGDFRITKHWDKASPKLYEALSNGKHLSKVTLDVCRAGGSQVKFMEITMEQVMISKVHIHAHGAHGSEGNGANENLPAVQTDMLPTETVHLNYGKITWVYTQQKRSDGSGGGNVTANHDLTTGKGSS